MFWIILSIAIFALVIWTCQIKPYSYWKNMGVPQMNPWIFLGDVWPTLFGRTDILQWMSWIYNKHPNSKYTGVYQFYLPTLVLRDPELIKQITVKDFDHFTDHNSFGIDEKIDPLWSKNLFTLKGHKWRDMRAFLSGSFTSSKMRIIYSLISDESEKFVNYFLKQDKDLIEVELKDTFTKYTNDVIATTSFGIQVNSLENPDNEFFRMGQSVSNGSGWIALLKFIGLMICPWIFPLLDIGVLPKRARTFFGGIINETIKTREEQGIVRPDMINLLLEVRRGQASQENDVTDAGFAVVQESSELAKPSKTHAEITNIDIAAQALIFFLAGFDTVSTGMCFTCYELAINPDIQDKLRQEIKDTVEKADGQPTYEDILGMKYMDMVVTEALRKWPPAPVTDRVCIKPYSLQPSNPKEPTITIKKSNAIWVPIYNIHHDPQYYPDPEKFTPERFSDENKRNIKPYTYLPFGTGPRACIGSRFALLETKSMLLNLLNNFEIVPTEKTQIPLKFKKAAGNFIPEGGFPLGFKRI